MLAGIEIGINNWVFFILFTGSHKIDNFGGISLCGSGNYPYTLLEKLCIWKFREGGGFKSQSFRRKVYLKKNKK